MGIFPIGRHHRHLFYDRTWLLPLGISGLLLVYTYTKFLNRLPFLCLLAPGLGFGIVMVMGTIFVLAGSYSWTAFFASLIPFFLVSNLLLLNQFPDVPADQKIGRLNYPIVAGKKASALIYTIFMMLTYVSIVLGGAFSFLPVGALLGLGTLFLAIPTVRGVVRFAQEDVSKLIPFMGMNVVITLATPILMGIGLLLS
jgi:1,4-dihydroxy-2-naphthoate octaprenyltransferase